MHSENETNQHSDWETCAICGSNVEPGRGAVRLNHRGNTVNVCGSACLEIFAQEPDPYLARLAKRMREHLLQEPLKSAGLESRQEEGSQPAAVFQVLGAKGAINTLRHLPQKQEVC